jgi:hypothetical protein
VGATKPDVILRHFNTRPGKVYNLRQAKQDIDSVYSTGLFDDVNIIPNEADESTELQPKVGPGCGAAGTECNQPEALALSGRQMYHALQHAMHT